MTTCIMTNGTWECVGNGAAELLPIVAVLLAVAYLYGLFGPRYNFGEE